MAWDNLGLYSKCMILESVITCPACGHQATETMPTDACQYFYICNGCGTRLKPKHGDCCVYCSYGTVPCPPIQVEAQVASLSVASISLRPAIGDGGSTL